MFYIFSRIGRQHHCVSDDNTRLMLINDTETDINNHSLAFDWPLTNRNLGKNNFENLVFILTIL
jgi:hypothetical protein